MRKYDWLGRPIPEYDEDGNEVDNRTESEKKYDEFQEWKKKRDDEWKQYIIFGDVLFDKL